jgi:hypothetical protein
MSNFGHWHIESLASIYLALKAGFNGAILVPALKEWQKKVLLYSGIKEERLIEIPSNSIAHVTKAVYPSPAYLYKADLMKIPPSYLHKALANIKSNTQASLMGKPIPKLFVERPLDGSRPLSNQAQLKDLFVDKWGFTAIKPETLSYEEQVAIFSSADIIAGLSGAAFTLLAFCKPKCKVIEISYERGWHLFWHTWATGFAEIDHYVYIEDEATVKSVNDASGTPSINSWEIKIDKVDHFLSISL